MILESLFGLYRPRFARTVVYMLQATEYRLVPYLKWFWRTSNFSRVMHRKSLVMSKPAKLLLAVFSFGLLVQYVAAIWLFIWAVNNHHLGVPFYAASLLIVAPIIWAHLVVLPLLLGRWLVIGPYYGLQVWRSARVFKLHPGIKIAVAGSYGKTTMKEILLTVLSEGQRVAATPANKNVSISHAQFAKSLKGNEEILIIEYGEGAPGDVQRFSRCTSPTLGIITGLAPAHLDRYKTLQRAGKDIFSLAAYLKNKNLFVNAEAAALKPFIKKSHILYSSKRVGNWKISAIKTSIKGVEFTLKHKKNTYRLKSKLIGRHQVGPLALAAVLAHEAGLNKKQILTGVSKIEPFEHRMQPYQHSGAWIIDDTYNGNIEGMRAGLELLKELPAKRKIYITPGLVDQGKDSKKIHQELGEAIAKAKPDTVVLMKHSVTDSILSGLAKAKYKGESVIEEDPLTFYSNLDHYVAAGDLVLMQNDWPDQYQ